MTSLTAEDAVRWESALLGILPDHFLMGRDVDAVNSVLANVAFQPLDLGAQIVQHAAELLRDGDHVRRRDAADVRNIALQDVLGHI